MKVKHTKNGNVKITLSLEQAEALRGYTAAAYRLKHLCAMSAGNFAYVDQLDNELGLADIGPAF